MNIKVWEGATLDEATDNLVSSIDNSDMSIEHIVIVPDRFSLLMEKLLLSNLKSPAMFNVSVVGLSSLVTRLLSEIGINNPNIVSMTDSLLLTARAIKNCKNSLLHFQKSNINFCHQVQNAISQFKSSGVKPDAFLNINNKLLQYKKFHDLGLIYEEYERLLEGKLDANGLLEFFNDKMKNNQSLGDKIFYFAEFDAFTSQTYELIKTLTTFAKEINISLPRSLTQGNAYIYETDILDKLKRLASELRLSVEVVNPICKLNQNQQTIAKNLFAFDVMKVESEYCSFLSSSSAKEEAGLIGKLLRYKVYKGAKYSDYAIACSDLEKYAPYFERVFETLDIPYYIDISQTADKTLLAGLVFALLNVFVADYSGDSLQSISSNIVLKFENAQALCKKILSLNIFGKARYKKYIAPVQPKLDELLEKLARVNSYSDISDALKAILADYRDSYIMVLEKLKDKGLVKEYNINMQAEDIVLEALDKIKEYNGDEKCGKGEFLKQLKLLLAFKEVSSVPTYVDAVMVGDATTSFFGKVKNLIIAGGEGLPILKGDNGLVSDDDIQSFSIIQKIEPSIRMINRRNRFKLFNLLCQPESSLMVSYLNLNEEGKNVEEPTYINILKRIFGNKTVSASSFNEFTNVDDNFDIEKLLLICGNRKMALEENAGLSNNYSASLQELLKADYTKFNINKTKLGINSHNLFFSKEQTKVSQLETYYSCPFKHFVRYGLKASDFENAEFDERDIGNICHEFADIFVKSYKNMIQNVDEGEIQKFIQKNLASSIKKLGLQEKLEASVTSKSLIDYINRIATFMLSRIVKELKATSFLPLYMEKQLEGASIKYENKEIKLVGKVDRVDIYQEYFRIIDYKTGYIAPLLKDLYYGDKLQLFLYEKAIAKMLNKRAIGTLYFDCRYDYDKQGSQDSLLKGLVWGEDELLKAYDKDLNFGRAEIISVSPKVSGGYKGQAIAKFSLENFELYAEKVAANALKEIDQGYIQPKPDERSCERCLYKSICLYNKDNGTRIKDRINQEDIMEVLEK